MKKSKFLLGAAVLSVGLMGTGYAAWTDIVTVGNTVTTGNLEVAFATNASASGVAGRDGALDFTDSAKYTKTTQAVVTNGDKATLSVTEICPGYEATFKFEVKNAGTMAAELNGIKIGELSNPEFKNQLEIRIIAKNQQHKVLNLVGKTDYVLLENAQAELNDFFASNSDVMRELLLEESGNMTFEVRTRMIKDAKDSLQTEVGEDAETVSFDLEFDWAQYNKVK